MPPTGANGNGTGRLTDGQLGFASGVDSSKLPTISSESFPDGLGRGFLAWANNCTMRDGAIEPRIGLNPIVQGIDWPGLYQGGYMYEPDGGDPYIMLDIGGKTYQVRVDTDNSVHNVTLGAGNPPDQPQHWLKQGEKFLVIQDSVSTPLVWDGVSIKQIGTYGGTPPYLPIGTAMDYYMGRMWVAVGRSYYGSDIVRGPSGTAPYQFRDSILHTTENAVMNGGGGFIVPTNAGIIRAIFHNAELDTALGQGRLYVGTRKSIYACNVPVNRDDWSAVTQGKIPLQTVAQINFGPVGDRSIVTVNGDVFYETLEPGIRSLTLALRYFQQWGNTPISNNENRVLKFNDRSLLRFSTGIQFDNRALMSALPYQTPVGVAHKAILPLDFNLISTLQEKAPPAWEGLYEGLNVLQLLEGDFGGLQRAFAVVYSDLSKKIEIWELKGTEDNNGSRIQWQFETPAYTWNNLFSLKELESAELWYDELSGTADIFVEYRPDSGCWTPWAAWRVCTAKDDTTTPYPTQNFCPSYGMQSLPKPPNRCQSSVTPAPSNFGHQFQLRVSIRGKMRVRGILVHALPKEKRPFENLIPCA